MTYNHRVYLAYISDCDNYEFRYYGGGHIEVDYGPEFRNGREFESRDSIGVIDYVCPVVSSDPLRASDLTGTSKIQSADDFQQYCDNYVAERYAAEDMEEVLAVGGEDNE